MYIKRAISDVLRNRAKSAKVVLVCGARQVGKSTVISHVFNDYNSVSFDSRQDRLQAREEPALFFMNNAMPLVIDEVQKEPSVLEEIKLRVDASDERGVFVLSGSQKLELMKGASESLAGRVSVLELGGLSLREIHGVDFNSHFMPNDGYISQREECLTPKVFCKNNQHTTMSDTTKKAVKKGQPNGQPLSMLELVSVSKLEMAYWM